MSQVPQGTVLVRLAAMAGAPPYAEFQLAESDLAWFVDPTGSGRRSGTIAHQAAETAWALSHIAANREDVEAWGLPSDYAPQVAEYRRTGRPGMAVGELAEVTRDSGARSVWRCTREDWVLLERQSAEMAARAAIGAEREAER